MTQSSKSNDLSIPPKRASPRTNTLSPGYRLDEYRVEAVLGAGSFGITYKSLDTHLETWTAIKEYFPAEWSYREIDTMTVCPNTLGQQSNIGERISDYEWGLERFLDEARVLAQVQHPSVVRVKRYFHACNTAYIVMDYEEGESLNTLLRTHGILSEERIRSLLDDVLSALESVHQRHFLHRDIKPSNLYVRAGDRRVILIDFGAARMALGRHTKSMTSLITPGYSPPEQYNLDECYYGNWTDIYALGAVLYRCVTGRAPMEAVARLLEDRMEPAVQAGAGRYSDNLLKVIDRALAIRPKQRFANAADMRAALAGESHTVIIPPLAEPQENLLSVPVSGRPSSPVLNKPKDDAQSAIPSKTERRSTLLIPLPTTAANQQRRLFAVSVGVIVLFALASAVGFRLWPHGPPKVATQVEQPASLETPPAYVQPVISPSPASLIEASSAPESSVPPTPAPAPEIKQLPVITENAPSPAHEPPSSPDGAGKSPSVTAVPPPTPTTPTPVTTQKSDGKKSVSANASSPSNEPSPKREEKPKASSTATKADKKQAVDDKKKPQKKLTDVSDKQSLVSSGDGENPNRRKPAKPYHRKKSKNSAPIENDIVVIPRLSSPPPKPSVEQHSSETGFNGK